MRLVFVIVILMPFLVNSCKTTGSNSDTKSDQTKSKKQTIQSVRLVKDLSVDNTLKSIVVSKAVINDSILVVNVSYSGCKDDVIELVYNGSFLKSYPPKVQLYFMRTPGKKGCESNITQELNYNLGSIKPSGGKELKIMLQNCSENLTYQYKI